MLSGNRLFRWGMVLVLLTGIAGGTPAAEWRVASPGGRVTIVFDLDDGAPSYRVQFRGGDVVLPSRLGVRFRDAAPMVGGFEVVGTEERSFDSVWRPVWGQASSIRDAGSELVVRLRERDGPGREMHLVFRAYDDGAAFRYVLPEQPGLSEIEIDSEETEFRFAGNHTAWWIPDDHDSYEHLYRETLLSSVAGANTPITMMTADGLYVSIHEANLTDYAGMTLKPVAGERFTLKSRLVPWPDGVAVKGSTPLASPWRTIQIGERPGDLVESPLIQNLNEPCAIDDTSWIRPAKYIGIWWSLHIGKETWFAGPRHGATTENAKKHIDFAAEHGIPALLIEGWNTGWDKWGQKDAFDLVTPYPDFDIEEVTRYGRERGVAIIGHHETGGDVPMYERQMDAAFSLYERVGVSAIKTGYAGGIFPRGQRHHGQWMVRHYRRVVEEAARRRIVLDVHEPIKPTGISRTYPNMMTREGVRGMEYNAWSEGNPPSHTTILPFTRMLAGPLDYTPGIFDITFERYKPSNRVHTTLAKQLALYVVLWSPLQMAADLIENYEGHPAFEFIERVPCDWDETRVPDAAIGDYVVTARRSGRAWYLGAVTDEDARVLWAPLVFLEPGTTYTARIFADSADADFETNPTPVEISCALVDARTILALSLARGGGAAIAITPATDEEVATLPRYEAPY
jgi:alpha-glucosidase